MNSYFNYIMLTGLGSTTTEMFHGFFLQRRESTFKYTYLIVIDTLIYYGTERLY